MGHTKALVPYRGIPLAARVAAALGDGGCAPVVLVGGDREELAVLGQPVLTDLWPGEGPLGGVLSALGSLCATGAPGGADAVVVAACDLAALTGDAVRRIIDGSPQAPVVVAYGARRHPTLALWRRDVGRHLEAIFASGERSLMAALEALAAGDVEVVDVTIAERQLENVNAPGDLAR